MSIILSNQKTDDRSIKKIGRKVISLSNAAIPTISILTIAAIIFHEYGSYAWGSFVSEFLWLSIAAKVVNYGLKEFILKTAGDERESTGERINESINAGMLFIPVFFFVFLLLPFGLTHVVWLTLWLAAKYIYQSYEAFYAIYNKQGQQLAGELLSSLFIITILLLNKSDFSVVYLLQLFSAAEAMKAVLAYVLFRKTVAVHFNPVINFTYLKTNFIPFAITFSILFKTRIDQLIATFCLPTAMVANYQVIMTMVLLSQSILYSLSYSNINKMYTLSYDYIRQGSNKTILRVIIPVTLLALIVPGISLYIYSYSVSSTLIISTFLILLSHAYSLSYIYALYKAKEEMSVILINVAAILITGITLPFIMLHYSMEGTFIFTAAMSIAQVIALKLRVRKLL